MYYSHNWKDFFKSTFFLRDLWKNFKNNYNYNSFTFTFTTRTSSLKHKFPIHFCFCFSQSLHQLDKVGLYTLHIEQKRNVARTN